MGITILYRHDIEFVKIHPPDTWRELGFGGSLALSRSATSDNTALGLGLDLGYYDGTNGHQLQLSYQYADTDSCVTDDSLPYDLEFTRVTSDDFDLYVIN